MSHVLTPRTLLVVTAVLGLLTAALAVAGERDLALAAAGLGLTALATLVWSAFSRIQTSLNSGVQTEKAMTRLAGSIEATDRRLVAAIETLRRDVHNQDRTPSA